MRHLAALAQAGMTDVHLLPVFDFGSVPERGCVTPADRTARLARQPRTRRTGRGVDDAATASTGATTRSTSTRRKAVTRPTRRRRRAHPRIPADGAGAAQAGLRVGMDVVYNHTWRAGQDEKVGARPHRARLLPPPRREGAVERSTCCANTATEHRMMAKLMIDSVALWATPLRDRFVPLRPDGPPAARRDGSLQRP
jgi:pullulanase